MSAPNSTVDADNHSSVSQIYSVLLSANAKPFDFAKLTAASDKVQRQTTARDDGLKEAHEIAVRNQDLLTEKPEEITWENLEKAEDITWKNLENYKTLRKTEDDEHELFEKIYADIEAR